MRAVLFLLAVCIAADADAQRWRTGATKTISSYTATNGVITNTSCQCGMCQRARAAAAAGQTKFCYGGKCYPINHLVKPSTAPKPSTTQTGVWKSSVSAPTLPQAPVFTNTIVPERVVTERSQPARSPALSVKESKPKADPVTAFDPTPEKASALMCALARVTDTDTVFDLGCGDGRNLQHAAEVGATCVGVEINPATAKLARSRLKGRDKVSIVEGDLFETDFSGADVVFLYLYSGMLKQLQPRLAELKPGTRIVSYCHDIPEACTTKHVVDGHVFFLWTVGDDVPAASEIPDWLKGS